MMDDDGRWTMMGWESGNGKWKCTDGRGRGICFPRVGKLYSAAVAEEITRSPPIPCIHSFPSLASKHPASSTHKKQHTESRWHSTSWELATGVSKDRMGSDRD